MNILVLDDEKEIADLVEVYLKNENYNVFKFYDSKEAIKCIENQKLDFAILDVMIKDVDGFEICKMIRDKGLNFPVIMLTAKIEDKDKIQGLTLGADDYITKPFNPLELIARVKSAYRRYTKYNEKVEETAANVCRRIEKLHHMVHIYRFTNDEFAMILYIKDENKIKQFLNNVEMAIIDYMTASSYTINYRIAAIQSNPVVSSTHKLSSMSAYLFNKIANEPGNQCYLATDKDYKEFHEAYKIEQLLLDIRNKNDLDDERVLCYAQPIFSVNNNSFRTAEALMRLSLDGTIIYPDKFIPIAEKNNCIHTLTRIILNKVCKIVAEFEKKYDFDAITINCSSSELSNRNLFDELMAIINSNNIMPEHIRLELTESAMFDDFNMVIHNMEKLNESGIKFYLDDFGTGYSNLERIIGCPFNTIKFDKTLLYKSLDNSAVSDIVSHLTSVFKEQGFVLLIEGVENEEQASYSIDKGFDYIQGYKYAKPQPVINLKDYFDKRERSIS